VIAWGNGHDDYLTDEVDVFWGNDDDLGWVQIAPGTTFKMDKKDESRKDRPSSNRRRRLHLTGIISPDIEGTIKARPCRWELVATDDPEKKGFLIKLPEAIFDFLDVS
jgi:hypothetical protein